MSNSSDAPGQEAKILQHDLPLKAKSSCSKMAFGASADRINLAPEAGS
jgi:hypothetical protein